MGKLPNVVVSPLRGHGNSHCRTQSPIGTAIGCRLPKGTRLSSRGIRCRGTCGTAGRKEAPAARRGRHRRPVRRGPKQTRRTPPPTPAPRKRRPASDAARNTTPRAPRHAGGSAVQDRDRPSAVPCEPVQRQGVSPRRRPARSGVGEPVGGPEGSTRLTEAALGPDRPSARVCPVAASGARPRQKQACERDPARWRDRVAGGDL